MFCVFAHNQSLFLGKTELDFCVLASMNEEFSQDQAECRELFTEDVLEGTKSCVKDHFKTCLITKRVNNLQMARIRILHT